MDQEELLKNPINYIKTLKKKELVELLEKADEKFFNSSEPLFPDDIYDIIKNYLRKLDPKNSYLKRVGADEEHKIKLPFYLGSQDKIKDDEKEIFKWIKKYNNPSDYIIDEKLDGISCLVIYENNDIKMYTRGNGIEGQDITHLKSLIRGIPNLKDVNVSVRGELIISKRDWDVSFGSNARNVVAGAINSKINKPQILNKIQFVAYDLMNSRMPLKDALDYINSLGFKIVKYIRIDAITLDLLSSLLLEWRKSSEFEIDGIVVSHNKDYKILAGKNPKYSFAFKSILTHEKAEVIVTEVEWNVSKDGYLKPIVKFNEVAINGVKIKQATGFNAGYIRDNVIGPGSRIVIIRSGDVIPHILNVLTPSANKKPSFPEIEYKWNDTNIDIIITSKTKNREQDIQSYLFFMKILKIPFVAEGTIIKLYDNGYDTLKKIINITKEQLLAIEGFKEVSSAKIIASLKEIHSKDCIDIINASNCLGRSFGQIKIKMIYDKFPFLISNKEKALKLTVDDLITIDGIASITATQFIKNLPNIYKFFDELGFKCHEEKTEKKEIEDNYSKDKIFVFSGFRDKELENKIIENGGTVSNTITKNTSLLIIKNEDEKSNKIDQATNKKIKIITLELFMKEIK